MKVKSLELYYHPGGIIGLFQVQTQSRKLRHPLPLLQLVLMLTYRKLDVSRESYLKLHLSFGQNPLVFCSLGLPSCIRADVPVAAADPLLAAEPEFPGFHHGRRTSCSPASVHILAVHWD